MVYLQEREGHSGCTVSQLFNEHQIWIEEKDVGDENQTRFRVLVQECGKHNEHKRIELT